MEAWTSLLRGNRIDSSGGLTVGGNGNVRAEIQGIEGENTGRDCRI